MNQTSKNSTILTNVHSVVFFVQDVHLCADWYAGVLGILPYRNDAHFVGFNIGEMRLGFHATDQKSGISNGTPVCYWEVENLNSTTHIFITHGATWHREPIAISEGGRVCQLRDPFGNIIGLIEQD